MKTQFPQKKLRFDEKIRPFESQDTITFSHAYLKFLALTTFTILVKSFMQNRRDGQELGFKNLENYQLFSNLWAEERIHANSNSLTPLLLLSI